MSMRAKIWRILPSIHTAMHFVLMHDNVNNNLYKYPLTMAIAKVLLLLMISATVNLKQTPDGVVKLA